MMSSSSSGLRILRAMSALMLGQVSGMEEQRSACEGMNSSDGTGDGLRLVLELRDTVHCAGRVCLVVTFERCVTFKNICTNTYKNICVQTPDTHLLCATGEGGGVQGGPGPGPTSRGGHECLREAPPRA